jgi:four helix bundle protein
MSERINGFEDLRVYQEACALDLAIFQETKLWPPEEKFALIDQVRRSSRSIGANIAESWAKRRYPAHFVSKLTDADGELQETQHWLNRANKYEYLRTELYAELLERCKSIGRKLGKMMQRPEDFSF